MTESAFRSLTQTEQVFKEIIWDPMIKAGEVWIEGAVPFLALPVIKNLDEFAIQELTDALYNQIVLIVDIAAIKIVGAERASAYNAASEALVIIAAEKGMASNEYKTAVATAISTLGGFGRLG